MRDLQKFDMKMKILFIVGIIGLATIISCKKNKSPNSDKTVVYVCGYTQTAQSSHIGAYWKNGILTTVPNTNVIKSIIVSGNDVYMLGTNGYWKNQVYTDLGMNSTLNSIYISNNDVYVAGSEIIRDTATASYWKNGTLVVLNSNTDTSSFVNTGFYLSDFHYSMANSIFVSGSDVYVAGYVNTTGDQLTYWKNGKATYFTNPLQSYSRANSIFVSGNDVYIAGWLDDYNNGYIGYWKNGVSTSLSSNGVSAQSILVENGNVFIAGYINNSGPDDAAFWENGMETTLPNGIYATGIGIANSDIYICGRSNNNEAIYWKNGKAHILGIGGATGISIGN